MNLTSKYLPPLLSGDTTATRYFYNLDRQITETLRPDSIAVTIEYDSVGCGSCGGPVGRPKTITFDRGDLEFRYSPTTGLLDTLIAPGNNRLRYTYDGSLPKSVTWSGDVSGSISVNYDNNFRVTSQLVNGANSVSFGYSNDGLLTSAGSMTIYRDAQNGRIDSTALSNVKTSQTYNEKGELASYTARYNTTTLFATSYERDSLGRITELTETVQGVTKTFAYAYDTTGRLIHVWRNDTLISTYTYDDNGNRLSHIVGTDTTYATYDDQDRLLTYGSVSYTYTDNGELRTKIVGTDTTTYTYDAFGNLNRVDLPNGDVVEYIIDGQNRRVAKKLNSTLVKRWIYEGQLRPVAEFDGAGTLVARFVYGSKVNVPEYVVKSGTTYRIITDHLGSVRLVINQTTGAVTQKMSFDEFGVVLTDSNSTFTPFGFAGGIFDPATELVRFGARDYDASVGRWMAKDPVRFAGGSTNIYVYGSNNPSNFTDPTGLYIPTDHFALTFAAAKLYGFSDIAAIKIAMAAAKLDFVTNSQNTDAEHAAWHATAGEKPPGKWVSADVARRLTEKYIRDQLGEAARALEQGNCDEYYTALGSALHATQDQWAPLHNFAEWHGTSLENVGHFVTHLVAPLIDPLGLVQAGIGSLKVLGGNVSGAIRR